MIQNDAHQTFCLIIQALNLSFFPPITKFELLTHHIASLRVTL